MIYNVVFIVFKGISSYTNLTKEELFDKLWEWTYEDDLWDFIDETNPTEEELISYLDDVFIDENVFHKWDEDDTACYAFCVDVQGTINITTSIFEYNWDSELEDYIKDKIRERYRKNVEGCYVRKEE